MRKRHVAAACFLLVFGALGAWQWQESEPLSWTDLTVRAVTGDGDRELTMNRDGSIEDGHWIYTPGKGKEPVSLMARIRTWVGAD